MEASSPIPRIRKRSIGLAPGLGMIFFFSFLFSMRREEVNLVPRAFPSSWGDRPHEKGKSPGNEVGKRWWGGGGDKLTKSTKGERQLI